jgi:DNA-binding response OmpR family regulator
MNVLIIEDNEQLCLMFAREAINHGCSTDVAFDFEDACAALRDQHFDIIFCDIDLGTGRNHGPKALLQSKLHGAKIVFMAANSEYDDSIQPLVHLGHNVECTLKPLTITRFIELLNARP